MLAFYIQAVCRRFVCLQQYFILFLLSHLKKYSTNIRPLSTHFFEVISTTGAVWDFLTLTGSRGVQGGSTRLLWMSPKIRMQILCTCFYKLTKTWTDLQIIIGATGTLLPVKPGTFRFWNDHHQRKVFPLPIFVALVKQFLFSFS